jgi:hypothetical protein
MQYIESQHQKALFTWARLPLTLKQYPDLQLLYANRNTQKATTKAQAGRIKAEGSKAGVPDIFLPVPSQIYHGLYIEMKSPEYKSRSKGGLSDAQLEFFPLLRRLGYRVDICYSWIEAKDAIILYLSEK